MVELIKRNRSVSYCYVFTVIAAEPQRFTASSGMFGLGPDTFPLIINMKPVFMSP